MKEPLLEADEKGLKYDSEEKKPLATSLDFPLDVLAHINSNLSPKEQTSLAQTSQDNYNEYLRNPTLTDVKELTDALIKNFVLETCLIIVQQGEDSEPKLTPTKADLEPLFESLILMCDSNGFFTTLDNFLDIRARISSFELTKLIQGKIETSKKLTKLIKDQYETPEEIDSQNKTLQKKLLIALLVEVNTSPDFEKEFESQINELFEQRQYSNFVDIFETCQSRFPTHFELPETRTLFEDLINNIKRKYEEAEKSLKKLLRKRVPGVDDQTNEQAIENTKNDLQNFKKNLIKAYIATAPNLARNEKYFRPLINRLFSKLESHGFIATLRYFETIYSRNNVDLHEIFKQKTERYQEAIEENKKCLETARRNPVLAYHLLNNPHDRSLIPENEKLIRHQKPSFISRLKGAAIGCRVGMKKFPFLPYLRKNSQRRLGVELISYRNLRGGGVSQLIGLLTAGACLALISVSVANSLPMTEWWQTLLYVAFGCVCIGISLIFLPFYQITTGFLVKIFSSYFSARAAPHSASGLGALVYAVLSPIYSIRSIWHSIKVGYKMGADVDVERLKFNPYDQLSYTNWPKKWGWGHQQLELHLSTIAEAAQICPPERMKVQALEVTNLAVSNPLTSLLKKQEKKEEAAVELTNLKSTTSDTSPAAFSGSFWPTSHRAEQDHVPTVSSDSALELKLDYVSLPDLEYSEASSNPALEKKDEQRQRMS